MTPDEYSRALRDFIAEEFLSQEERALLTETSPLVESGILDSLRVAVLLTYIRDTLGVSVPLERIDFRTFADIRSIAGMLTESATAGAGATQGRLR